MSHIQHNGLIEANKIAWCHFKTSQNELKKSHGNNFLNFPYSLEEVHQVTPFKSTKDLQSNKQ